MDKDQTQGAVTFKGQKEKEENNISMYWYHFIFIYDDLLFIVELAQDIVISRPSQNLLSKA
jgi:hypothetical protein